MVDNTHNVRLAESDGEKVVISLAGSINMQSCDDIEKAIEQIRADHPDGTPVFDFEHVSYISSVGLRVLIRFKNKEKGVVRIINVPVEIMDIFDQTGFTRIFDIYKAVKHYDMKGLQKIAQGTNGEVYRLDNENIVKVFAEKAPIEIIERERELARQALIFGIPTALSYTVSIMEEEGKPDRYGIVFEALDADTLSIVLKEHPDAYEQYVNEYTKLYKTIHEIEDDAGAFSSIKKIYMEAIEECSEYYTDEEVAKLRALVEAVPDRKTLIHGDYHPNNIMVQDGELILIDMGDMSIGHPIFDFLATAATQVNLVKLSPEYAEFHTRMPAELISRTWDRLMEGYFAEYTTEERERIEKQICDYSKLKVALAPYFGRGAAEKIIRASVDDAKANFIPMLDELTGAVDW
jgi:uncharacterized protein (TIGR02172 family)